MTPSDLPDRDDADVSNFQEFNYPYVLPEADILVGMPDVDMSELTPLEDAFVRWLVKTGDVAAAMQSLCHPAHPFDMSASSPATVLGRKKVIDVLDKIRKANPYCVLYSRDYTLGLLHDEIEYLRARRRRSRYDDEAYVQRVVAGGKKSPRDLEISDTALLLDMLKLVVSINSGQFENAPEPPAAEPGDEINRISGLIAEAERKIVGGEVGDTPAIRDGLA